MIASNLAEEKPVEKKGSTLDTVLTVGSVALALDAIIVPFFTGKTIHEWMGLPPASDYKVWGDRTALMAERAIWGVLTLYQMGRYSFQKYKKEN